MNTINVSAKEMVSPLPSVKRPSSRICKNLSKIRGCAFSISSNNNKENSNNISIEIKKQINNIMNIDTFKKGGVCTEIVKIDKGVEQWE